MTSTPEVITRYLAAADAQDAEAMAACFTEDGSVVDEGETYKGHDEIVGWRAATAAKWTYTSTVTGTEPVTKDEHRVFVHVEGNFPGGVADLTYRFSLDHDRIAALTIAG
jgi:uncharacterized protein (TIGR02246 family)